MSLNEPYRSWFVTVVGAEPPDEPLATCHDCPMCRERDFLPAVKCCTYIPALPSFQVGRALRAGGEGAARVRAQLATARTTEAWLLPSADAEAAYDAERARFGATRAVRCPYVTDDGRCAIHAYRNAVCAAWFCKHDRGEAGAALWDAATELFQCAEGGVAVWASGDGWEVAADRAATLTWSEIRRIGGRELREREEALRDAWARWLLARPGP